MLSTVIGGRRNTGKALNTGKGSSSEASRVTLGWWPWIEEFPQHEEGQAVVVSRVRGR